MTSVDPQPIAVYLKKLRKLHQIKTFSALFGGAILALLGPMLITVFYLLFSLSLIASYGFWGAYWIIAAVTLPIIFLMAYFLKGSVLERWGTEGDSFFGRFFQRKIAVLLVILEVANIGPRLVLWAIDRMRDQSRVHGATLDRVAQCLATLMATDGGVSPAALLLPGESPSRLEPLLAFLLYHELVDLSKQGDRVWLISHIRRNLEQTTAIKMPA